MKVVNHYDKICILKYNTVVVNIVNLDGVEKRFKFSSQIFLTN